MIHYKCPCCDKALQSPLCDGGKEWDCPMCKARFLLPYLSSSKRYKCIDCRSKIHVEFGACSHCGTAIQLPILYILMAGLGIVTGFISMFLYYHWLGNFLGILKVIIPFTYITALLRLLLEHRDMGITGKKVSQYFIVAHLLLTIVLFSLPAYQAQITTWTTVIAGIAPLLVCATVVGYARNGRVIACFKSLEPEFISVGIVPALETLPGIKNLVHERQEASVKELIEEYKDEDVFNISDSLSVNESYAHGSLKEREDPKPSQKLRSAGIRYLYHFTDSRNIESIKKYGLLSHKELTIQKCGHVTGGDPMSLNLDKRLGYDKHVHLSLNDDHPMEYVAKAAGRISNVRWLQIEVEVVDLPGVLSCPAVANSRDAQVTPIRKGITDIDLATLVEKDYRSRDYQQVRKAEILVPSCIPTSMILNLY